MVTVAAGRAARTLLDFAVVTLLMRMLGPEPFGLVAMVTAFMAAFAVMSGEGVGLSLVSDSSVDARKIGAATIVAMGFGAVATIAAVVTTPALVWFYGDDRFWEMWLVAAAALACAPLTSVPIGLAQRAERFSIVAFVPVASSVVGGGTALALAQVRHDYWPILLRHPITAATAVVLSWSLVRPALNRPTRAEVVDVFRFGRGVMGSGVFSALVRNSDNLLVGRSLGEHQLALYALGYRVLMLPLGQIGHVARTLSYPRISRQAHEPQRAMDSLGTVMGDVARVATPIGLGAALVAEPLIRVVFGEEWLGAVVPFRILAILSLYQAPFQLVGMTYQVTRQTHLMVRWQLISAPITVASFVAGLPFGIVGVATSYSFASVALGYPLTLMAARAAGVSTMTYFRPTARGLLDGIVYTIPLVLIFFTVVNAELEPGIIVASTVAAGAATMAFVAARRFRRNSS